MRSAPSVRIMIQVLSATLRAHPEITFFLVLGIGYALGKLKVGSFSLGAVTGTLLAGVAVGQLGVTCRVRSGSVSSCCSCSQ